MVKPLQPEELSLSQSRGRSMEPYEKRIGYGAEQSVHCGREVCMCQ